VVAAQVELGVALDGVDGAAPVLLYTPVRIWMTFDKSVYE